MLPDVPGLQMHWYPLIRSSHLPPNRQGLLSHSSICVWQRLPVKPGKQLQVKEFSPSMQVPLWQGLDWQSLMLVSQEAPVKPGGHSQV